MIWAWRIVINTRQNGLPRAGYFKQMAQSSNGMRYIPKIAPCQIGSKLWPARIWFAHRSKRKGGFIILHQCGNDFYFLIANTWRGNNEVWETVFYKDGEAMADFALWPRERMHKPTFCVWELALVWHEKGSWERFPDFSTRPSCSARLAKRCLRGPSLNRFSGRFFASSKTVF